MNLSELSQYDESLVLIGDFDPKLNIAGISHSDDPIPNTFVFLKNKRYLKKLGCKSETDKFLTSGLVIEKKFLDSLSEDELEETKSLFLWMATVENVDHSMCLLSKPFYDADLGKLNFQVDGRQLGTASVHPDSEISQNVFIGEDVIIEEGVKILPGAVIMPRVQIGKGTIIFPNVTIYPLTKIGEYSRIHAGTVLGTDGFGYNFFNGAHQKIWHLAGLEIGDHVEIGGNCMIDAGAFTPTEIGDGSRIDNIVHIAHNAKIGKHVVICGTCGFAGSVEIEDYCAFGAGAGVAPSAHIKKGAQIAARAVVSENAVIPEGQVYAGHPARPLKDFLKAQATLNKLAKKKQ